MYEKCVGQQCWQQWRRHLPGPGLPPFGALRTQVWHHLLTQRGSPDEEARGRQVGRLAHCRLREKLVWPPYNLVQWPTHSTLSPKTTTRGQADPMAVNPWVQFGRQEEDTRHHTWWVVQLQAAKFKMATTLCTPVQDEVHAEQSRNRPGTHVTMTAPHTLDRLFHIRTHSAMHSSHTACVASMHDPVCHTAAAQITTMNQHMRIPPVPAVQNQPLLCPLDASSRSFQNPCT